MELCKRFDGDYGTVVRDIQDNFQDNLNRHIRNDISRNKNDKVGSKTFHNVGFNNDTSTIYMGNIKVLTPIQFNSPHIRADLLNECIKCEFGLKDLRIDAEYCTVTPGIFDLAVRQHGKLNFTLKAIHLNALIGLFAREDSLVPVNYDITYTLKEIETKMTSYEPTGQPCEHNCYNIKHTVDTVISYEQENTLITLMWVELQQFLNEHLQRLMASNIVEYSFGEMFLDEPEEYRSFESDRIQIANAIFDEKLRELKAEYTKAAHIAVSDPPLRITFKVGTESYHLETTTCHLDGLDTLGRITDASYYEDDVEKTFYAHVALSDFTYVLDNSVISSSTKEVRGCIKLSPDRNKFFLKFQTLKLAPERNCRAFLNVVALEDVIVTEKQLSEHDNHAFTYVIDKLMPYMLGYVRFHTNGILQKYVKKYNDRFCDSY